jgi:hypothetical protein
MGSAVQSILSIPDKLIGGASSIIGGLSGDKPEAPAKPEGELAKPGGPKNEEIEARSSELKTREQALGKRAAAAGATRSDNDADVLGFSGPKRRAASRSILG